MTLFDLVSQPWWNPFWTWVIIITTFWESRGEFLQGRTIWRARAAAKIPLDAYAIDVGTFAATVLYGVTLLSSAYIINGLVTGAALVYVFLGVMHFGTAPTHRARVTILLVVSVLTLMAIATSFYTVAKPAWALIVVTIGMSVFLLKTIWGEYRKLRELAKNEGVGQVNIQANNTWLITNTIFVLYALGIHDPIFFITCIVCAIIQSLYLRTYCRKLHTSVPAFMVDSIMKKVRT